MLPAYGRQLLALRESGRRPARAVYVTDHWSIARSVRAAERFVLLAQLPTVSMTLHVRAAATRDDLVGLPMTPELRVAAQRARASIRFAAANGPRFDFSALRDLDAVLLGAAPGWAAEILPQMRSCRPASIVVFETFAGDDLDEFVRRAIARAERERIAA